MVTSGVQNTKLARPVQPGYLDGTLSYTMAKTKSWRHLSGPMSADAKIASDLYPHHFQQRQHQRLQQQQEQHSQQPQPQRHLEEQRQGQHYLNVANIVSSLFPSQSSFSSCPSNNSAIGVLTIVWTPTTRPVRNKGLKFSKICWYRPSRRCQVFKRRRRWMGSSDEHPCTSTKGGPCLSWLTIAKANAVFSCYQRKEGVHSDPRTS
jgi:hypothetical protein